MHFLQLNWVGRIIKSKIFILTVSIAFVITVIILAYFLRIKNYSILINNHNFQYIVYTDNSIGGNSKVENFAINDSLIKIIFKLNNAINSQYVGISIAPKNHQTINLAHYNQINIKVRGYGLTNLGLSLFEPKAISKFNKQNKEVIFYTTITISTKICIYEVPIHQFQVPDWWFEQNGLNIDNDIKPRLNNVICLNISNGYTPNMDDKKTLEIYAVTFLRNNRPLLWLLIGVNLIIAVLTFFSILVIEKIKVRKNAVTITYKPIEIDGKVASKSDIISYINNNFQNSELTLEMVSAKTGVSQRRITNLIQEHYNCNFKMYLNRLRINESKRLLLETGLNIGEIAFKVGFNNQSHFNRVFKIELQRSPSEYRDKNEK